jgi:hypothetical protein
MNNNLLMGTVLFSSLIYLPLFLMTILCKIKILRGRNTVQKLFLNFVISALVYILNANLLPVYLGVYIFAELMHNLFSRYTGIKVLDRILISCALGTLVIFSFYHIHLGDIFQQLSMAWDASQEQTKKVYETALKMSAEETAELMSAMTSTFHVALTYMKNNFLFISFICLFVLNYSINFVHRKDSSSKWEISYLGLLVYIIPVLVIKFTGKSGFLLENLLEIGQFIYMIYGIKAIYNLISKKVRVKGYTRILSIIAAVIFPKLLFLIGAFKSFNIKIKIVRK